MVILGLTGSIAMGKSTTAKLFRLYGVPVFDADLAVHDLMRPGGPAIGPLRERFGQVTDAAGGIDRGKLGRAVLDRPAALKDLERLIHPMVRRVEGAFLARSARNGDPIALLDIPLLFETGGDRRCDATVVVTAPSWLQRQRVLARPGMTPEKLAAILARQMPNPAKCRRADFLVRTGAGLTAARHQVEAVMRWALAQTVGGWPDRWLRHGALPH